MSDAFLDRLKNRQLTNIDQYRRMQNALSKVKSDDQTAGNDSGEAWKQWQLVPVSSDNNDAEDPALMDPQSQGAQGLYRAVRQLSDK